MSGNGRLRALLEAKRRERIRLENVRNQCRGLISAMKSEIQKLNSSVIQSIGENLVNFTKKLDSLDSAIENTPDTALEAILSNQDTLVGIIHEGNSKAQEWDSHKLSWEDALLKARISVESISQSKFKLGKDNYDILTEELDQLEKDGHEATEIRQFQEVVDNVQEVRGLIESENVTREIIKSVRKILIEKGFTPSKPKHSDSKIGTVELVGMLSPGRNAKFWISPQGDVEFDFEGYSGTTCKDTIDDITKHLIQHEEVDAEIVQFDWHNPDKIEKGAKDLPIGGQVRSRSK